MKKQSVSNIDSNRRSATNKQIPWNSNHNSESSTSTQFYKEDRKKDSRKVTRKEFLSESESISLSDSYPCSKVKKYTEKGLLKRNLIKNLDPIPHDPQWSDGCPQNIDWSVVNLLEFMVLDPMGPELERFEQTLKHFVIISRNGFKLEYLESISKIIDYLSDHCKVSCIKESFSEILKSIRKPIIMKKRSDMDKYFSILREYFGILGYILLTLHDDSDFGLLYDALVWQLSAVDKLRGPGTVGKDDVIAAAAPVLVQSVSRMIGLSSSLRFPAFIEIAVILACKSFDNCIQFIEENILEYILSRFNPYFPHHDLASDDIGPTDIKYYRYILGDSTNNSTGVLSLLLVLLKSAMIFLQENPNVLFPVPEAHSIRCFAWAFRYECRAKDHQHQRICMAVICSSLLHCYGQRLPELSTTLMADVLSLSIATEVPIKAGWIRDVIFNTVSSDVHFKKLLLYLSADFLRKFPLNNFMMESQFWLMGLLYLLDPAVSSLRPHWSRALYQELHIAVLQILTCTLHLAPPNIIRQNNVIRRLMWYVEWYSHEPYELRTLYWTLRVIHSAIRKRKSHERKDAVDDLYNSHGIIVLTNLSQTLLNKKFPPTEKTQVVLSLNLRLLTSVMEGSRVVACNVYPNIIWPDCVNNLDILNVVKACLDQGFMVSERLLISLMNFIWEAIVWNEANRNIFISSDNIYKLLDILTMTSDSVQCIILAVLCDLVKGTDSVAQLITWRAKLQADEYSHLVKHSSTITTLLASIVRDECKTNGVCLDENGIIQDIDNPLTSKHIRSFLNVPYPRDMVSKRTPDSYAASDIAGSRLSKVFALLHLLSEDLQEKVDLVDEKYKLYKNVELACEDEVILILSLHYLTAKLQEVWMESRHLLLEVEPEDASTLNEFLELGRGWAKEIKEMQEDVLKRFNRKEKDEETSLYSFLGRVRLNLALESLAKIRCMARTADRVVLTHGLLHDAVHSHQRRQAYCQQNNTTILSTYKMRLDDQNLLEENVKMKTIPTGKSKVAILRD